MVSAKKLSNLYSWITRLDNKLLVLNLLLHFFNSNYSGCFFLSFRLSFHYILLDLIASYRKRKNQITTLKSNKADNIAPTIAITEYPKDAKTKPLISDAVAAIPPISKSFTP